jgi:hypothetical protein
MKRLWGAARRWWPWLVVQGARSTWVIAVMRAKPRSVPAVAVFTGLWLGGKLIERWVEARIEGEG